MAGNGVGGAFPGKSKKGGCCCSRCRVKAGNRMKNAVLCRFLRPESHLFHALFCPSQKGVGVRSRGFHPSRAGFRASGVAFSCIRNAKIAIKNAQNGGFWEQKGENTKVFLPDAVFYKH